jgi:hypothetical protein
LDLNTSQIFVSNIIKRSCGNSSKIKHHKLSKLNHTSSISLFPDFGEHYGEDNDSEGRATHLEGINKSELK